MKTKLICLLRGIPLVGLLDSAALAAVPQPKKVIMKVLDPRGSEPPIKLVPMAPRVRDLNGKVVYLVDINKIHGDWVLNDVADFLKERFPGVTTVYWSIPRFYGQPQPELLKEVGEKANAVVFAQAD